MTDMAMTRLKTEVKAITSWSKAQPQLRAPSHVWGPQKPGSPDRATSLAFTEQKMHTQHHLGAFIFGFTELFV